VPSFLHKGPVIADLATVQSTESYNSEEVIDSRPRLAQIPSTQLRSELLGSSQWSRPRLHSEFVVPSDGNVERLSPNVRNGTTRSKVGTWPTAEIVIDEISGRLPPFDGLSEQQLRSEQISQLDDRSASTGVGEK
jgi:hypothetical protein